MPVKNNNRADRGKNKKAGNAPKLSAEQELAQLAKELRLRPKTIELIEMLQNDKKLTQTEAYMRLHDVKDRRVAQANASRVLSSDSARVYSDAAVGKAKRRIVSLVQSRNENTALKASQDILDRNEGKAVQKSENLTRTVEVKLDLSGVRIGAHYLRPEQLASDTTNP